jgi:hypothetical protein
MGRFVVAAGHWIALLSVSLILGGIGPPPSDEPRSPLRAMLVASETRPFPGTSPLQDQIGKIYPEGARAHLLLQGAAGEVIEIDHIYVRAKKLLVPEGRQLAYSIDPLKQPGFGFAAPRKFNVVFNSESSASIYYTDEHLASHQSTFPDLLPLDLPLLRLDVQSGVQETLDLNIKLAITGLYQIEFQVVSVSGGKTYVQTTDSVRIFKQ